MLKHKADVSRNLCFETRTETQVVSLEVRIGETDPLSSPLLLYGLQV